MYAVWALSECYYYTLCSISGLCTYMDVCKQHFSVAG